MRNDRAVFHVGELIPDSWLSSRQNGHHGNDLSKLCIAFDYVLCCIIYADIRYVKSILKAFLGTSHLDDVNGMFDISMLYLWCPTVFALTTIKFLNMKDTLTIIIKSKSLLIDTSLSFIIELCAILLNCTWKDSQFWRYLSLLTLKSFALIL